MNPLKRDNNSVRATNHENRIQTLERRLATDFPVWSQAIMDQGLTVGPGTGNTNLGWLFPDTWADPTDPAYDDLIFYLDDMVWLPVGYDGVVEIYMTVASSGGAPAAGTTYLRFQTWVYRAGAVFASSSFRAFVQTQETPPPTITNAPAFWTNYSIYSGPVSIDAVERDRLTFEPLFVITSALGGPLGIDGLVWSMKLHTPGTGGFGWAV